MIEYFTEAELASMPPLLRKQMDAAIALANTDANPEVEIEGMGGEPYDVIIDPMTGLPVEYPAGP